MLTTAQAATLVAALVASTDPVVQAMLPPNPRLDTQLRDWCNADHATAIVWRTSVSLAQVGQAMLSSDIANLTTGNTSRLQVLATYSGGLFNPSLSDLRAGFADIFSVAGASGTRAALLALWKRKATNAEAVFATGTKSDAVPGLLVFEGSVSLSELSQAMNTAGIAG